MFPKGQVYIPYEELLPLLPPDQEILSLFKDFLAMPICKWQQGTFRMFPSRQIE